MTLAPLLEECWCGKERLHGEHIDYQIFKLQSGKILACDPLGEKELVYG